MIKIIKKNQEITWNEELISYLEPIILINKRKGSV